MTAMSSAIVLNLLLQLSLLSAALLLVIKLMRGRIVWHYHLAYFGLLTLALLTVSSILMQAKQIQPFALELPVAEFFSLQTTDTGGQASSGSAGLAFETPAPTPPGLEALMHSMWQLMPTAQSEGQSLVGMLVSVLAAIWLAGAAVGIARLLLATVRLGRLQRVAIEPTAAQRHRLHKLMREITAADSCPAIKFSDTWRSPVLVGFVEPMIILPVSALRHCNDEQLKAVLLHELAHWQRRDNLANLLQQLIVALLWIHPCVHWLSRIASRSREEICDNHVLAQQDALHYSETLLWFGASANNSQASDRYPTAVAMFDRSWRLEERIQQLLNKNRETSMTLSSASIKGLGSALLIAVLFGTSITLVPASRQAFAQSSSDGDAQMREPPQANDVDTLGETVYEAVTAIQELMSDREGDRDTNLAQAKAMLDTLYESSFATGNSFEKSTILNFYTNYHLSIEDYPGALARFEQILQIDQLRPDTELRTLRSLGQLYAAEERWPESIDAYNAWREKSEEEDGLVFRGLSYGHYQIEQYEQAREFWLEYLGTRDREELSREDLAYLNGLHFVLSDLQSALALTQEMILRFNEQRDWDNLRVLYEQIDDQSVLSALDPELGSALDLTAPEPQIAFASVVPTDGDYIPLLATAPMYPRVAADQGIEGWVLVEFTVGADGVVQEESIAVVDAEPSDVFNRNSINAAREFVFSPRMEAGTAVPVPGVQYLFRYQLRDDDA
jgi:TonB family protein